MKSPFLVPVLILAWLCLNAPGAYAQSSNPNAEAARMRVQIDSLRQEETYFQQQLYDARQKIDSLTRKLDVTQLYIIQTEGVDYYTTMDVALRSRPTVAGDVVGEVKKGARVKVYDTRGTYSKIQSGTVMGWVSGSWLSQEPPGSSERNALYNAPAASGGSTPVAGRASKSRSCCKVCRKGKPCGNTCIARNKTCRVGPGCAC